MKALTAIHLAPQGTIRVAQSYDTVCTLWAQMTRSAAGSAFAVDQVNGHGALKRVALLAGTIMRVEEL